VQLRMHKSRCDMPEEVTIIPRLTNGGTFLEIPSQPTGNLMTNTIPDQQNAQQQLERLAAQRALYSRAKIVAGMQAILSVPAAVAWSVFANIYPTMKPWAALWGLVVTLLDVGFLETLQSSSQKDAAKIQEAFDCAVLDLPWNTLVVGSRPDPERIAEAAQKYRPNPKHPIENWYPREVADLPISSARLVCQRTNLWWDWKLRQRYGWVLLGGGFALAVASLVTGLARHYSLEVSLLTFWVPLAPAYLWTVREFRKHQAAAKVSDTLKGYVEGLWGKALAGSSSEEELKAESRKVQDQIYLRRRDSTLVFDWIYNRLQPSHEMQATKGAADLVREALTAATGDKH